LQGADHGLSPDEIPALFDSEDIEDRQGLEIQKREGSFAKDSDRNGIGGSSAIFLNNLERIQELPEHLL
jgi:hypothetical protein